MDTPVEITVEAQQRIPLFLKLAIASLVVVSALTIVLLFVDNIEDRGSKIFLTFVVFGLFVALTGIDNRRELSESRNWYLPLATVSNVVFLFLGLVSIWLTRGNTYMGILLPMLFMLFFTLAILRAALIVSMLAMRAQDRRNSLGLETNPLEEKTAKLTVGLLNFAAMLLAVSYALNLSIPEKLVGYESFWDIYTKVTIALLILSGLGFSISMLLSWYFRTPELRQQQPAGEDSEIAQTEASLLPWPLFPDGTPYPRGKDGNPDFEAANSQLYGHQTGPTN